MNPRTRSILKAAVKWSLFALVAVYVTALVVHQARQVDWSRVMVRPGPACLAVGCLIVVRLMTSLTLWMVLAGLGVSVPWRVGLAAPCVMQLGKYVPGKVFSVTAGIWILNRQGRMQVGPAATAVLLLTGAAIVVSLIVAAPITLWEPVRTRLPAAWLWCLILVVGGTAALHPRVFLGFANFVLRRLKRPQIPATLSVRPMLLLALVLVAQRVVNGLALFYTAAAVTAVPTAWAGHFIAITALAEEAGFLAVFAPAGLGVREGLLLMPLSVAITGPMAAVVVVAYRVIQTLVELGMGLVALLILRGVAAPGPAAAAAPDRSGLGVPPPDASAAGGVSRIGGTRG